MKLPVIETNLDAIFTEEEWQIIDAKIKNRVQSTVLPTTENGKIHIYIDLRRSGSLLQVCCAKMYAD